MPPLISNRTRSGPLRGQTIVLFALSLVVLCGLVGFTVDSGIAYARRAKLQAAVDAGAIVGTRYLGRPSGEIRRLIYDAVLANDPGATLNPTNDITIRYEFGADGLPIKVNLGVIAQAVQPLTFMRVIVGNKQTGVAASAESVRFPITMAVIIDRSGSMTDNGGSTTIPATIPAFLSNFVPGFDTVGIYSYSWTSVRELGFTTNFQSQAMRDLFNSSANRIQFAGYTAPADCLRMALQDMEQLRAYNEKGVKKIVVFMTDGLFNTFRTRPPNVMDAFSSPPPGVSQSTWETAYLNDNDLYSSLAQWGTDGSGHALSRSQAGPSYNYPALGGGFTFVRTNSSGSGVVFQNLDAAVNEALDMRFPAMGVTQSFVFAGPSGGTYTNRYIVPGKGASGSGYPEGKVLDDTSIRTVSPKYRYSNASLPGDSTRAIDRYEASFRFLSAVDGSFKRLSGANVRAEAREHALRYCAVARKTRASPNRITFFTIGFGSDDQLDIPVLMRMSNLNPSDRNAPYTPLDSNEPFDETFGFTLARNADELNRTYIALGIYLATRLTK